jgi:triacylglycerol esterase/lipase EstA (alpha/beta hydrolase family)
MLHAKRCVHTTNIAYDDVHMQLYNASVGRKGIIWVAHSMGGLIVKQLITHELDAVQESKGYNVLASNTKMCVFVSTPHFGSPLADKVAKIR